MQKIKDCLPTCLSIRQIKQGSALAYSLIILAVMLFIVSSMSFVSLTEKKSASSTDFSMQAYQTADSGFQLALKAINSHLSDPLSTVFSCDNVTKTVTVNDVGLIGAKYVLSFEKATGDADCDTLASAVTSIRSIGTYKNTARAVEVTVAGCNINTCTDLQNMQNDLSGNYALCSDIDCSATSSWDGGAGFAPVGPTFNGFLDGRGYAIKNLYMSRNTYSVGLFQSINGHDALIKNVTLKDPNIRSTSYNVGGFVGVIANSSGLVMSNVVIEGGTISSSVYNVGGLAGTISNAEGPAAIENSAVKNVTISGTYNVGGLAGTISNADNNATIISNSAVYDATINASSYQLGGLAGRISNANGPVISNSIVGNTSLNGTTRKGALAGGVTIVSLPITLQQSYWESNIASAACGDTSSNCTGDISKTKAQLQTATPFPGWSTTIWKFQSGSYPCLIGVMSGCS